jgi:hypothetical protein
MESENETPAKAKRGLNEIYTKYKEYLQRINRGH